MDQTVACDMARTDAGPRRVTLPFTLGDFCFLRLGFNALVEVRNFDPSDESVVMLTPPEIPDGIDVAVRFGMRITDSIRPILTHKRSLCYMRNCHTSHYIDLRGTFENYLGEFSSKRRGALRRNVRNLSAMANGTMVCKTYRKPDEVAEFHKLARGVAAKTYQERLFDGAIPNTVEFITALQTRAGNDSFRGFILLLGGRPIAYMYLSIDDGVIDLRYLGYDPEFADWSPGTVLMYLALEQLFAEGSFRYFNLSYGEGQMKQVFGRGTFMQGDLYFFRWNARNIVAVYTHYATDRISRGIGNLLSAVGMRKVVRKILRTSTMRRGR